MFFKIVIIIAVISVLMSIFSIRKQNSKAEIKKAKKDLKKGRVIFQSKN
jgi:hypothetical protein